MAVNRFVLNGISYHGHGAIHEIPGIVKARGLKKAFVASDPDLVRFGVTKRVTDLLEQNGIAFELYTDIKPNPTIENVQHGVDAYRASGADFMITIGGGSSMDTGKGIGIIVNNPEFYDVRSLEGVAPTKHRTVFTIAVPTVLFSIISSVARIQTKGRLGKILGYTILVFVITGIVAGILMIIYTQIVSPSKGIENLVAISSSEITEFSLPDRIVSTITVTDFPELFSKSHILPLIIACILIGAVLAGMGDKAEPVRHIMDVFADVCMKIVQGIMKFVAPIGLIAYFAALIADLGPQLLGTYARVMLLIYYPLGFVYFFLANLLFTWLAGKKEAVKAFFGRIFPVAVTAFGTQSSLAAMPGNLEAAQEIGVPKDIRSVVIPLGATAHMDGAVMSNMLKIAMMVVKYMKYKENDRRRI